MESEKPSQTMILAASALVHADEYMGEHHPTDMAAFESLMEQLRPWLAMLDDMALLPIRRDGQRYNER